MSIVQKIEEFEATSRLTLEVDGDAFVVELTRLPLGFQRWALYLFFVTVGLVLLGYLAYPYMQFPDGNGVWVFVPMTYLFILACMLAEVYIRKGYYRNYRFEEGQVRILRSDYSNYIHKVPFIPRRIIVETTVPLIRGRLIIADPETRQTIRTGDSSTYVERFFVGEFLAEKFGAQFIPERELTDREKSKLEEMKVQWENEAPIGPF